jgi:cbb3-type cytochrome oxidase maturation protein
VQAHGGAPKVIGLANAGSDTVNCVKQAAEFGLARRGIKLASLLMFLPDVHALGLATAQGLICTETFYWDLNERTRAFSARVRPHIGAGNALCMNHAGGYASWCTTSRRWRTWAWRPPRRAAPKRGADEGDALRRRLLRPGSIRPDGRKLHPAYLFEVKKPEESRGPSTTTSCCRPRPARRRSGRSARAAARWCGPDGRALEGRRGARAPSRLIPPAGPARAGGRPARGPPMLALLWLIPLTLALGGAALALFLWSARSGQFDDLDAAAHRILSDDDAPSPRRPPPAGAGLKAPSGGPARRGCDSCSGTGGAAAPGGS